jgi:hypothetical protein
MDPRQLTVDSRLNGICAYCGGLPGTSDHVPSKVFLDQPYPQDLPVVECCHRCNSSFSDSEQYVACFLECVKAGTTNLDGMGRDKIVRTLAARTHLTKLIEASRREQADGPTVWLPDLKKVRQVVIKLATGHLFHELSIPFQGEPESVSIAPLSSMCAADQEVFFSLDSGGLWPELGSRSFKAVLTGGPTAFEMWRIVQEGNYAYAVGQGGGNWAKILMCDYLACHVAW